MPFLGDMLVPWRVVILTFVETYLLFNNWYMACLKGQLIFQVHHCAVPVHKLDIHILVVCMCIPNICLRCWKYQHINANPVASRATRTQILDLLVWWLEQVKHVIPNGGFMVIYYGRTWPINWETNPSCPNKQRTRKLTASLPLKKRWQRETLSGFLLGYDLFSGRFAVSFREGFLVLIVTLPSELT